MLTKRRLRNAVVWIWAAIFIVGLLPGAADSSDDGNYPSAMFKAIVLQAVDDVSADLSFASPDTGDADLVHPGMGDPRRDARSWRFGTAPSLGDRLLRHPKTGPPAA